MDLPFKAFSLQSLKVHSLVFPSGCGVSALNEAERGNLRPIGYVFENRLPWRYAAVKPRTRIKTSMLQGIFRISRVSTLWLTYL